MPVSTPLDVAGISERYFEAWRVRDVNAIMELHSPDTQFWLHSGGSPAKGLEAVRKAFTDIFNQWPELGCETYRVILGDSHWVLDWALTAVLADSKGIHQPVRFDCLDVVTLNEEGLVVRKDLFVDFAQATAAASRAGVQTPTTVS